MTDPATPDELAALFLRGRDVPCPGCGYNRRDGTASACPECGKPCCLELTRHSKHRAMLWILIPALAISIHDFAWAAIFATTDFRHELDLGAPPLTLALDTAGPVLLPFAAALCWILTVLTKRDCRARFRLGFLAAVLLMVHLVNTRLWSMPDQIHYLHDRLNPAIIWD